VIDVVIYLFAHTVDFRLSGSRSDSVKRRLGRRKITKDQMKKL
jgi:hypothetical protein